jgi:hypothetical protein
MRITHMCEFCLSHLGISDKRREKESKREHNKFMSSHKPMCSMWNKKAALALGLRITE